jgi:hypothetical protein
VTRPENRPAPPPGGKGRGNQEENTDQHVPVGGKGIRASVGLGQARRVLDQRSTGPPGDPHRAAALEGRGAPAPIDGGAPCDVCGSRAFRTTPTGLYRHQGCEPPGYLALLEARRSQVMGEAARRAGTVAPKTSPRATWHACPGCCRCRGKAA